MNAHSVKESPRNRALVLVPTSRFVDKEMELEVGRIPPVLVPLNGAPLLHYIVERFTQIPGLKSDITLIADQGAEQIEALLQSSSRYQGVRIVRASSQQELGATIASALSQLDLTLYDHMYINFGDTLVDADLCPESDAIYFEDLNESYRWTTFQILKGRVCDITDRFVAEQVEESHVFTGLFYFKNPQRFAATLLESCRTSSRGSFYHALENYLSSIPHKALAVHEWIDCGHADNYYQARKRYLNKRFFNQLEIDEHRAVLLKKSSEVEKFSAEIRWYLEIPVALRCYVPQIFDYSLDHSNPFVRMEYYGYPTLSTLFLNEGYSLGIWHHAIEALFFLLEDMDRFRFQGTREELNEAMWSMYVEKTLERLLPLRSHEFFGKFFAHSLEINGTHYQPLNHYLKEIPRLCREYLVDSATHFSVIHGDLCLTNILFDPRSRILKLIDPRGRFGRFAIYGDQRYELAKLSHSFNGGYDLITSDAFSLVCDDYTVSFSLNRTPYQHAVTNLFNMRMAKYPHIELKAISLIESLLFLSMIPLHADKFNRQIAMLATGVQCLESVITGSHRSARLDAGTQV